MSVWRSPPTFALVPGLQQGFDSSSSSKRKIQFHKYNATVYIYIYTYCLYIESIATFIFERSSINNVPLRPAQETQQKWQTSPIFSFYQFTLPSGPCLPLNPGRVPYPTLFLGQYGMTSMGFRSMPMAARSGNRATRSTGLEVVTRTVCWSLSLL